jgi:DNA-binding NarL/FixJ family response regulator/anti-sigma regulatory factor (Ser/Thr protein kinase)
MSQTSFQEVRKYPVLYVDDERLWTENFQLTFEDVFEVYTETSAQKALELLTHKEIPIIIADIKMPDMDGIEFLSNVSKLYPKTVRLVLTAYADPELIIDSVNRGYIFGYILKPWEKSRLEATIKRAMEWYRKRERPKNEIKQEVASSKRAILEIMGTTIYKELTTQLCFIDRILKMSKKEKDILAMSLMIGEFSSKVKERLLKMILKLNRLRQVVRAGFPEFLHLEHTDINHLLENLLKDMRELIPKDKRIEFKIRLDSTLPSLLIDCYRITSILKELISNSVGSIEGDGVISVSTFDEIIEGRRNICIKIEDSGAGIKAKDIDKIFIPFYTTRDMESHLGLGLCMVEAIMEAHGGEVYVSSKEKQGTSVKLCFPC